jgi:hypothetical protein
MPNTDSTDDLYSRTLFPRAHARLRVSDIPQAARVRNKNTNGYDEIEYDA